MLAALGAGETEAAAIGSSYSVRGVLQAFDQATQQATIAHEEIRGYMPSMTMSFSVVNPAEVRDLRPGDTVTFVLRVTSDRAWIERIHKENVIGLSPATAVLPNTATELPTGSLLPDAALVDETGRAIHLHDFRGKALAMSFIYLACPLPTYCPLVNRNFEAAQGLVGRLGEKEKTQFLSISIDPENDTPDRLAAFAKNFRQEGDRWTFVTGRPSALHDLGGAVGLEFQTTSGRVTHNLRTVVVDPAGRIWHVFRGNTWTPQDLVAELRSAILDQH